MTKSSHSLSKSRLDELLSFFLFGIDVKITPENKLMIIEINGIRSGMAGFRTIRLRTDSIPEGLNMRHLDTDSLKNKIRNTLSYLRITNPVKGLLYDYINSYGPHQIFYLDAKLYSLANGIPQSLGGSVLNNIYYFLRYPNGPNRYWEEYERRYHDIANTLLFVEITLEDKLRQDNFFRTMREFKPRTYTYNTKNIEKILSESEYVVVKPRYGAKGDNIGIFSHNELNTDYYEFSKDEFICEPFAFSKPIYSEIDKRFHDGCMRYVMFGEEYLNGVVLFHFGGYWRLCPEPISNYPRINATRANLSKGAYPQRASEEDILFVGKLLNDLIPEFYNEVLYEFRQGGIKNISH